LSLMSGNAIARVLVQSTDKLLLKVLSMWVADNSIEASINEKIPSTVILLLQSDDDSEITDSVVTESMNLLSENFKSNRDALKFEIASVMLAVLSSYPGKFETFTGAAWTFTIKSELVSLYGSKLSSPHRDIVLALSSMMLRFFGPFFLLDITTKPTILLIHIVCAEIRVLLDQIDTDASQPSTDTRPIHMLPICLELMQGIINLLIILPQDVINGATSAKILPTAQKALVEAILAIVAFLDDIHANYLLAAIASPETAYTIIIDRQIVVLSLRIISEWIAEESNMPKKKLGKCFKVNRAYERSRTNLRKHAPIRLCNSRLNLYNIRPFNSVILHCPRRI